MVPDGRHRRCIVRRYLQLSGVLQNMAIGTSLVIAVLFFTLGWRAAFIVAMVIPFATIVSVAGLQAAGIPIHQMSITGLIVALGLLVDGAIVMTDEVRKRLQAGVDINTIRSWLGHVSLTTTNIYAEIDLETKARALAACAVSEEAITRKRWRDQPDLMQFLRTL